MPKDLSSRHRCHANPSTPIRNRGHPYLATPQAPVKAPLADNYIIKPGEIPIPSLKLHKRRTTPVVSTGFGLPSTLLPSPSPSSTPLSCQGAFYYTPPLSRSPVPLGSQGAFYHTSSPSRSPVPLGRQGAFYCTPSPSKPAPSQGGD
ncbi:hypothetical protein CVT24_010520 [Panaeolus cyanescens]|uniref:Uncharacterized protein n=1 Tax=Panaeolus cyanescens TaxID=181874 RepID=A0A409YYG2_9AGAR|nr:hypothetical protein CVT24_010520 [Panaeolus cyanescens]